MEDCLFKSNEDFFAALDEGIKLTTSALVTEAPSEKDRETLKQLMAVFLAATIQMDPKAFRDPELDKRLLAVRMAMLAAYNLGRSTERDVKLKDTSETR